MSGTGRENDSERFYTVLPVFLVLPCRFFYNCQWGFWTFFFPMYLSHPLLMVPKPRARLIPFRFRRMGGADSSCSLLMEKQTTVGNTGHLDTTSPLQIDSLLALSICLSSTSRYCTALVLVSLSRSVSLVAMPNCVSCRCYCGLQSIVGLKAVSGVHQVIRSIFFAFSGFCGGVVVPGLVCPSFGETLQSCQPCASSHGGQPFDPQRPAPQCSLERQRTLQRLEQGIVAARRLMSLITG